jgi:hypothetical protein
MESIRLRKKASLAEERFRIEMQDDSQDTQLEIAKRDLRLQYQTKL